MELPRFFIETSNGTVSIKLLESDWDDPEQALPKLWEVLKPHFEDVVRRPLSQMMLDWLDATVKFVLESLIRQGVLFKNCHHKWYLGL